MTPVQKSIAATVLLTLTVMQLISIGVNRRWFGRFNPHMRRQAVLWHRFEGYFSAGLILLISYFCIQLLGPNGGESPRVLVHSVLGFTVIGLTASKIVVKRFFRRQYRRLPVLGVLLFIALIAIWMTSAGWYFFLGGSASY